MSAHTSHAATATLDAPTLAPTLALRWLWPCRGLLLSQELPPCPPHPNRQITVKEASGGSISLGFSDRNFKQGRHPG